MIPSDSPRKPAVDRADRERQGRHREEQREDPAPLLVGAVVLQERGARGDHHRAGEADQRHAEHGRPRGDVRDGVDEDRQVDEAEHDRAPAEQRPRRPAPAGGRGDEAAEDPADGLRRRDGPEGGGVALEDVLHVRREQGAHDPLADRGDQAEDEQHLEHARAAHRRRALAPLDRRAADGSRGTGGGVRGDLAGRLGRRPDQLHQQRGQQERRRVDDDDRAEPTGGRDDPAHRAADEPGDVADLPVQGVGGHAGPHRARSAAASPSRRWPRTRRAPRWRRARRRRSRRRPRRARAAGA